MKRFYCARVLTLAVCVCSFSIVPAGSDPGLARPPFSVAKNGFSISNSPGYCFAIAAFSKWYYLANPEGPPLRKVFSSSVQERIAKELQAFYSKNLVSLQADYCNKCSRDPGDSFRRFVVGLTTGEPRMVLLMNRSPRGVVLHAILAYEWLPEEKVLKVYDPNYGEQERLLDMAGRQYKSLDITYKAICFPEVLDGNEALTKRMELLYARHAPKPATRVAKQTESE